MTEDLLICVDENDRVLDHKPKSECHDGDGILHRAFSVFLFNDKGETLLQKRSAKKRLWGGFWSNSCCSHPRKGEAMDDAAVRRLDDELKVSAKLTHLFRFQYQAAFGEAGSENELCSVYVGRIEGDPQADPDEIEDLRWIGVKELTDEIDLHGDAFTPWMKMEWERLIRDHRDALKKV